jgi:hypothetical protein
MKWLQRVLFVMAIGMLSIAAIGYYLESRPPTPSPPFEVTPTEIDLPDATPGTHTVMITIRNSANIPRKIVGFAEG